MLDALGAGAGIGLGISAGKSIGKGIKKLFGGRRKKHKKKMRALQAQNAQLTQENQQLRQQLCFARGAMLAQPYMQQAAFASGVGYGSLMQNYANNCLNSQNALLQASTLGGTNALFGACGNTAGLCAATSSISSSVSFGSANGRFNAYQMAAYQQGRLLY